MAIDDNTSYELTGRQVKDLANKVKAKADSASLASVATSGLYSDLTGAPTIPTVYNGTLTINQNGTTVGTFTANQSTNTTISLAGGIYADDPTSSANPDGWITPSDIDWSTMVTTVGSGDNVCYKYPDGTMVALVRVTTTVSYAAWGNIYESYPITPPNFAEEFISTPFCVTGIESGGQAMLGYGSGANGTGSGATKKRGQSIVLMRKDSLTQSFTLVWQAIGRWK